MIGLASSILAFLDVSYRIVRGTYEIYGSISGATQENTHAAIIVQDLEKVVGGLKGNAQKINDPELIELSQKCHSLSRDLVALLGKLQAKDGSRRESLRAAFAVWRKQDDVRRSKRGWISTAGRSSFVFSFCFGNGNEPCLTACGWLTEAAAPASLL